MHDYVMKIILSYVKQKRENLKLASEYPAIVLFDNFSGQCTEKILKLLDANNMYTSFPPPKFCAIRYTYMYCVITYIV